MGAHAASAQPTVYLATCAQSGPPPCSHGAPHTFTITCLGCPGVDHQPKLATVGSHPAQVLICKLIDLLDPGVPWDVGPLYDEHEPAPVVARNER